MMCIVRILLRNIFPHIKFRIHLSQKYHDVKYCVCSNLPRLLFLCASDSEKAVCLSKSNFLTMLEMKLDYVGDYDLGTMSSMD